MVKNPPANAGDKGLTPGSGRSPGRRNGNLFEYFCLENPTEREAWWATDNRVAKSQTQLKQLSVQAQAKSSQRDIVDLASLNLKKFSAKT